jgi:hypothetical protein
VTSGEYYSARTIPDLSHYSDPTARLNELKLNPPQGVYGNAEELNQLNAAMLNSGTGSGSTGPTPANGGIYLNSPQPYIQLPEGFRQVPGGQYNTWVPNAERSHYSDPNERIRELERNPPQPNYVTIQEAT